jgi:AraC family transcriptional regulator of arabinose operon
MRKYVPMLLVETEGFVDVIDRKVVDGEVCPLLRKLGIRDVGITRAGGDWAFIRPSPGFGLILVTIGGEGLVVAEGSWKEAGKGAAYVMPAEAPHGYRVSPKVKEWHYVWVRFEPDASYPEIFREPGPWLTQAAAYSLHAANMGLLEEVARANDPRLTGIWCDLIRASLVGLLKPVDDEPRLSRMWSAVGSRLNGEWSIDEMAGVANVGREHLRRLCQKYYGCSPRQRLTLLRLRKACELLMLTNETHQVIAEEVGYGDAFSFSKAFAKEFGEPPAKYREREKIQARDNGIE